MQDVATLELINQLTERFHPKGIDKYVSLEIEGCFYTACHVSTNTHLICKQVGDKDPTVIYCDGFWFDVDTEESHAIVTMMSGMLDSSIRKETNRKLKRLKQAKLLPSSLTLLLENGENCEYNHE